MKKLITKYLLTIVILPAFLTGCYTQLATQDDSNLNYSSDESYQDYVYEGEENTGGGYFDETDTLENYYYDESDDGEVVINNYYGYNPFYSGSYYDYYPTVSISFGFGYLVMAMAIPTTIPGTPDGIILITPVIAITQHIITRFIILSIILITVMEDITADITEDIIVHIIKPDRVMYQELGIVVEEVTEMEEEIR